MFKELFLKAKVKDQQNSGSAESGRTMTEMLGVLVIMGILSLGGIAGYRYGMNKHKANETIAELSLYAVDISTQMINNEGADVQLSNLPLKTHMGYPLSAYLGDMDGYFELEVSDIPVGVCEQILRSGWQVPTAILVNGSFVNETEDIIDGTVSVDEACNQAENSLAFEFYKTLTPCEGDECGSMGGSSGSEEPEHSCPDGQYWNIYKEACTYDSCEENMFVIDQSGRCAPCPTADNPVSEAFNSDVPDSCSKCPNASLGNLLDPYDQLRCLYCPAPRVSCGNLCCQKGEVCKTTISDFIGDFTYECSPDEGCHSDKDCQNSPDGKICDTKSGQCIECRSYADCGKDEYCAGITGYDGKYFNDTSCTLIPTPDKTFLVNGEEWLYFNDASYWFEANDLCHALGKSLPSLNDITQDSLRYTPFWTNERKGLGVAIVVYGEEDEYEANITINRSPILCH